MAEIRSEKGANSTEDFSSAVGSEAIRLTIEAEVVSWGQKLSLGYVSHTIVVVETESIMTLGEEITYCGTANGSETQSVPSESTVWTKSATFPCLGQW